VANRLASATSPYLLQHRDNPVDWWEWGPEPFEEARRRNVPVLLSVGYSVHFRVSLGRGRRGREQAHNDLRGSGKPRLR